MKELYVFVNKGLTNFYRGYLKSLSESHRYKRMKAFNLEVKVEISEYADYKRNILYTDARAINHFIKKIYKGKSRNFDKLLDRTFPSKDSDYRNDFKRDMIVIKSQNKKFLAKLKRYFHQKGFIENSF